MAQVSPLRGVRFNPEHVRLGGVLAPPYDVIDDAQREELYARDLRNIVRVDYCRPEPGDVPGVADRYTRAAQHLDAWRSMGILIREERSSVYVYDHEFVGERGAALRRRGVFLRIPAKPWDESEIRPHEGTLRGPKEDRLALMRASAMQTSAVFGLWAGAPDIARALDGATQGDPVLSGRTEGERGPERHLLWAVDDPATVRSIVEALRPAALYIADGHHRYETAVAYAAERRAAAPGTPAGADFEHVLAYLCAASDPAVEVLPTHRIIRAAQGVPTSIVDLSRRLGGAFTAERVADVHGGERRIGELREGDHAFAVVASDGVAVFRTPRRRAASPRESLDVVVLHETVLGPACGITSELITNGALTYSRSPAAVQEAVRSGGAAFGVVINGCTTDELTAVSDAREVMPQKSTYFSPKVPTGLVLSPL